MLTTKLMPLLTLALLLVSAVQTHAHGDHHDTDAAGEFDDYDEGVSRVKLHAPPESLLDFLGLLAPVLKYYVVLMGLFVVARYFNRMVEAEDVLKEKEMLKRPALSRDLMRDSDEEEEEEEEEESEGEAEAANALKKKQQELIAKKAKKAAAAAQTDEDEVHEELFTDGAKLVTMSESELKARQKKKSHPLFEGLQKIEEELKQKKAAEEEEQVSWNDLHHSMLKRYQQKYPEHGLRVQKDDDYDDEFKELLKKHNIDADEIRRELKKDA